VAIKIRLNEEITAREVRLIGLDGKQLGIVSRNEALEQARQAGYDLAEIAPNATPPVAKILDWGKYRYEQTKQLQKSRKHQKSVEVKQVRLGLKIGDHDLNVKLNKARQFLLGGNKVKISLLFRGREITHPDLGHALLGRVREILDDVAAVEQEPQMSGRSLEMILGIKKDAKAQNPQRNGQTDQGNGERETAAP
jgi:translation initiation factor IF-3